MNISPYGVKLNTFKISIQKGVNINYITINTKSSFRPLWSISSSQAYASSDGLYTYPLSVYLCKRTTKYSSQDPPPQNKVIFSWCQLCDVRSSVHYCTYGDVQSLNNKILSLPRCQQIYAIYAIHIYTWIELQNSNAKIYLLEWWRVSKRIHNEPVLWVLYFWLDYRTIALKVRNITTIFLKI